MASVSWLRARFGWQPRPSAPRASDVTWTLLRSLRSRDADVRLNVIMAVAGHGPSGVADAFGGYLCRCRAASWSSSDAYGPYGGCPQGWYDAREFLARYGVPDDLRLEDRG